MSKRFRSKWAKICRDETPVCRKFTKQLANRTMRRWAKRDPENAPRKRRDADYSS